jgi:hypothetical protein
VLKQKEWAINEIIRATKAGRKGQKRKSDIMIKTMNVKEQECNDEKI